MHGDAIDRTGLEAEFAAGAFRFNNGMHLLGSAQDGIYRAGLYAKGAANACLFIDRGHRWWALFTNLVIQGQGIAAKQVSKALDDGFATGWATVYLGFTTGDGLGVGAATGKTALTALSLGQNGIYLIRNRVGLDPEANRGVTQQQAKSC
jgi:hypothetical protein